MEETVEKMLVTVNDACERLSISRSRIYQEIGAGRLRSIKLGKQRLIAVRELERYVDWLGRENNP